MPPTRLCDHAGCEAGGEFRAPRSRLELNHYYWFCLEHVRGYNAAWNYYAGMSEIEIEAEIRRDTVWQRPSWKLGQRHGPAYEARINDPLGLYGKDGQQQRRNGKHGPDATSRAASAREQALAVCQRPPAQADGPDFRATSLETLRQIVASGAGITLLPALAVHNDDRRLTIRPMGGEAQRTIALVWRHNDPRAEAYRLLLPAIRRQLPRDLVRVR